LHRGCSAFSGHSERVDKNAMLIQSQELRMDGRQRRSARLGGAARLVTKVSLWMLTLGVAFIVLISWLDPALPWPMTFHGVQPWHMATLNVIPVLMITALLTVLTRRVLLASWLSVLVLTALYTINSVKLSQLATPLLPDDFHFLRELRLNYSFLSTYLAMGQMQLLVGFGMLAITLLLVGEPALVQMSGIQRVLGGIVILGASISLLYGAGPWSRLYNPGRLQFEPWAPADSAQRTGLITNLLLLNWELARPKADVVDSAAATQFIRSSDGALLDLAARRSGLTSGSVESPDIIILQSESLFDPSRLRGVADQYLPNLRRLADVGWSGDLAVPTFGGGTIRTEFELLTGLPLRAFPEARYPYLQLLRQEMPGLVRVLAQRGYRTLAIHPNGGAFWNRNHAFREFGFESFIEGSAFVNSAREGWYIGDAALTDRVIAELRDTGPPQLILAISIQNHGPYTRSSNAPALQAAMTPVPSELDGEERESWLTYVNLLSSSDAQLGRLASYLQSRERHTLLLFYSDHLPPLNGVFAKLPFADGLSAQQQPVPWLLLDNRSSQSRRENTASWLLPGVLMEKLRLSDGAYFDVLQILRERWSLSELGGEEMQLAIAAIAQLQYRDQLASAIRATQETH
jgi:hypothetical protein